MRKTEVLKAYLAKYYAADPQARIALSREAMTEDFVLLEPPELPQGGTFRGWDAGPQASAIYTDLWDVEMLSIEYYEPADGDMLITRGVYRWTSKADGQVFEGPIAEFIRFDTQDRMTQIEVFHFDPAGLVGTLPK